MNRRHEEKVAAQLAKAMAMVCVRNTMLEDLHAGRVSARMRSWFGSRSALARSFAQAGMLKPARRSSPQVAWPSFTSRCAWRSFGMLPGPAERNLSHHSTTIS